MMNLKGVASLIIAVATVVGFILWIPALKYFLLGALVAGVIVVFILRAWYAHKPVKSAEDEQVKLHLND
jgi:hypothetical protein